MKKTNGVDLSSFSVENTTAFMLTFLVYNDTFKKEQ